VKAVKRRSFSIALVAALLFQWNGFARAQEAYP
jgi:hypothetical protein